MSGTGLSINVLSGGSGGGSAIKISGVITTDGAGGVTFSAGSIGISAVEMVTFALGNAIKITFIDPIVNPYSVFSQFYSDTNEYQIGFGTPVSTTALSTSVTLKFTNGSIIDPTTTIFIAGILCV